MVQPAAAVPVRMQNQVLIAQAKKIPWASLALLAISSSAVVFGIMNLTMPCGLFTGGRAYVIMGIATTVVGVSGAIGSLVIFKKRQSLQVINQLRAEQQQASLERARNESKSLSAKEQSYKEKNSQLQRQVREYEDQLHAIKLENDLIKKDNQCLRVREQELMERLLIQVDDDNKRDDRIRHALHTEFLGEFMRDLEDFEASKRTIVDTGRLQEVKDDGAGPA